MSTEPLVVVFDGVCVLCNGWVRFLMARDPLGRFRFASMQSTAGRELLTRHGLDPDDPASLLLVHDGHAWTDTDAIRRVLHALGGGWALLAGAMIAVPRALRDRLYRWVARHRYSWFGRHVRCVVPTPTERERFLD